MKSLDWKGNRNSIFKTLGASNHTDKERECDDFYATEPKAIDVLCEVEKLDGPVWECACGQGHMSERLKDFGYEVFSTDLVDRGYGRGCIDFLNAYPRPHFNIVTNPPYKYAQEFVEKALEVVSDGKKVCMFLKLQFLEGKKRKELFQKNPPRRDSERVQEIGSAGMKVQLWTDLSQIANKEVYNLPLMKVSAFHRARGDEVKWLCAVEPCDVLYQSKIFSNEWTYDNDYHPFAECVIKGGTGYDLQNKLPFDIEHQYPDYSLYGLDYAVGFCTRGCPNNCPFCICTKKEGNRSLEVAEVAEFWHTQRKIKLLDPNVLACRERERIFDKLAATGAEICFEQGLDARFINNDSISLLKHLNIKEFYSAWDLEKNTAAVQKGLLALRKAYVGKDRRDFKIYVLVNFNTDWRFDIERVEWLSANGFDSYIMVYEKWRCDDKYKHLQRAVNNKKIFNSMKHSSEYKPLAAFL